MMVEVGESGLVEDDNMMTMDEIDWEHLLASDDVPVDLADQAATSTGPVDSWIGEIERLLMNDDDFRGDGGEKMMGVESNVDDIQVSDILLDQPDASSPLENDEDKKNSPTSTSTTCSLSDAEGILPKLPSDNTITDNNNNRSIPTFDSNCDVGKLDTAALEATDSKDDDTDDDPASKKRKRLFTSTKSVVEIGLGYCLLDSSLYCWKFLLKLDGLVLCESQLRNRDAAMRSRERKKMYVKDLEMKSRYLEAECRRLGRLLQCCYADNQMLRISLQSAIPKPESAVLLLESLLLGSLVWFMALMCLSPLPRLSLLSQDAAALGSVNREDLESAVPREKGTEAIKLWLPLSYLRSKKCRASRTKMKSNLVCSILLV